MSQVSQFTKLINASFFQQVKKKGVGLVEEKQIILHEEGRMDDAVAFSRSQVKINFPKIDLTRKK